MTTAKRIRERRLAVGMTIEQLSKALGVSVATIQRWEYNQVTNIKYKKILHMANLMNTTPEYLLGFVENPNPKTLFSEERLRFQWEIKHPNQEFDPEAFEEYKKPIDRCHEKIINFIDDICLSIALQEQPPTKPMIALGNPPSKDDPDYEEYMSNLSAEMLDSLGEINERRLESIFDVLESVKEYMELKVRASNEISLAEF